MLAADGTKIVKLSKQSFLAIQQLLDQHCQESECTGLALADVSGTMFASAGVLQKDVCEQISAVAAANYSSSGALAQLLGEPSGFSTQLHEGRERSLYVRSVDEARFILVVFSSVATFGVVRVVTAKTAQRLSHIMLEVDQENERRKGDTLVLDRRSVDDAAAKQAQEQLLKDFETILRGEPTGSRTAEVEPR